MQILEHFQISLTCFQLKTLQLYSADLPVIHHILKKEVLSISDDGTQLDKDMKIWILSYLEQKYTDAEICEFLILATFLDPQFITKYVPTMITEYVPTMITEYHIAQNFDGGKLWQMVTVFHHTAVNAVLFLNNFTGKILTV